VCQFFCVYTACEQKEFQASKEIAAKIQEETAELKKLDTKIAAIGTKDQMIEDLNTMMSNLKIQLRDALSAAERRASKASNLQAEINKLRDIESANNKVCTFVERMTGGMYRPVCAFLCLCESIRILCVCL
jgi:hypothetical protein